MSSNNAYWPWTRVALQSRAEKIRVNIVFVGDVRYVEGRHRSGCGGGDDGICGAISITEYFRRVGIDDLQLFDEI